MGIFLMLIAGMFASVSNYCMRRSVDSGGTTKAFLMIQLSIAALVAICIGPIRTQQFAWNGPIVLLGVGAGLIYGLMLLTLGRALEKGPPGLTIATLNAATVLPAIAMAVFFGAAFGFIYTVWHGLGSLLVLAGLFWAGKGLSGLQNRNAWLLLVTMMFLAHLLFLVIMQWRALVLNWPHPEEITTLFSTTQVQSQWFMPFIYIAAAAIQIAIYLSSERRIPNLSEGLYGFFGGAANSLCTYFLIWSTEAATSLEQAVIFPIFSVSIIILCNLWGQKLYDEKVNWKACQLCVAGLFIGTVDWKSLLTSIGF